MADILVYHADGTYGAFSPAGTSDSDRGAALIDALDNVDTVSGDTVVVPPGVYLLALGESATRDGIRVHLRAGAEIRKQGKSPGAIVLVDSGQHVLSGFGRIVNKGTGGTAALAILVSGGQLIGTYDYAETFDADATVLKRNDASGTGDLVIRGRHNLAINYDGIETAKGEVTIDVMRTSSTSSGADADGIDGNAIEDVGLNAPVEKLEIRAIRADSIGGDCLNLRGPGSSVIECTSATSVTNYVLYVNAGRKDISVNLIKLTGTNQGGFSPTPALFTSANGPIAVNRAIQLWSNWVIQFPSPLGQISANELVNSGNVQGGAEVAIDVEGFQPVVDVGSIVVAASGVPALKGVTAPNYPNIAIVRDYASDATANQNISPKTPNHN